MFGPVQFPLVQPAFRGATLATLLLVVICLGGMHLTRANQETCPLPAASGPATDERADQPVTWPVTMIHLWFLVPQFLPHDS